MNHDVIARYIGLAKKAGDLSSGTEGVRGLLRSGKARIVILATDCSDNASKRIKNCAENYGTKILENLMTMEALGIAIGSAPCAAVAISNKGLAQAIIDKGELYGDK